jgi:hypothetical protein
MPDTGIKISYSKDEAKKFLAVIGNFVIISSHHPLYSRKQAQTGKQDVLKALPDFLVNVGF